ncbi:MAG: DNA polymerase III subunit alpha [Prevotellaceae bacterium]|nr:DNA polymerase III subunit alpha [Prevotellaceae bacterium]
MSSFVHLHVHSHYSILDGMATVPALVDKAVKCGMPAIALTDHGNMFGIKEFYDYTKKKNKALKEEGKPTIKPILGVEAYVARRSRLSKEKNVKEDRGGYHLILLAKNKKGYQNLCKLVSISWIEGSYYKPRIDKEVLEQYREGLIVCSACLGGEIPQKLLGGAARDVDDEETAENDFGEEIVIPESAVKAAEESIHWFKNVFGDDYYLEMQRHKTNKPNADTKVFKYQQSVNRAIVELARRTNTKLIATNDVHFVEEEHAEAHDRLICLSTGKDIDDPKRMRYTKQEWLKTPVEMQQIFADVPEVFANTLEIAEKVEEYSIDSDAIMPNYEIPGDFGTIEEYKQKFSEEDLRKEFGDRFENVAKDGLEKVYRIKLEADYLENLTMTGAKARYGENINEEVMERIRFELDTMKTMGFPGYFLIVQDFINAGRQMGISFGPGRGSAAGSVVAYCLRITDIDPLVYDLLFERFLNPDRISMPDIDVDIEADGRGKVLQWVTEKYGAEKVARIITYGTMATKSSIKDVARVHKLPLQEAERLVKLIPDKFPEENGKVLKVNIKNCIEKVPELNSARFSNNDILASTLKYAEMLEGTVRQTGVHACGVIIGADDLSNFVPLSTADDKETKEKVTVTQYEGGVIENVGLIKMDFLGLETLDIIKETLKNIKKSQNTDIDIAKIPLDDEKTFELFSKGQTIGIFQFESAGMQKYLRDLKPSKLDDLIAMNALYRPGPMQYIPSFVNRKHGLERITYDIPVMEKRLKETYGITVYQEQVMLLSRDLAGFTRGQSDELRKAMGKKLVDKMASLKEKFISGGKENGHDEKVLNKIWGDWAEFAKYAFNKSHSACYALLAYQTGYLKANYPSEFMAAILTRSLNDIKEVSKLMDECRTMGIQVLGADVNESDMTFMVNRNGHIRFGLGGVKGVGGVAVEQIIKERENGAYTGIFNFVERVNLTACNKKAIESLALAGAFDNFSEIRREDFFGVNARGEITSDVLIRYGNTFQMDKNTQSNSLFGDDSTLEIIKPDIPKSPQWSVLERLSKEKEYIGIYLSAHPLDDYKFEMEYVCNTPLAELRDNFDDYRDKGELRVGGTVTAIRNGYTKTNKPYGVFTLEDYSGAREFAIFGDDYLNFSKFMQKDIYLMVMGKVQERGLGWYRQPDPNALKVYEFKITHIVLLPDVKEKMVNKINININIGKIDEAFCREFFAVCKRNAGNILLYLNVFEDGMYVHLFARDSRIALTKEMTEYLSRNKRTELFDSLHVR